MAAVPLHVLLDAGFSQEEAAAKKELFDKEELQLDHLANGDVSQDMLREEFGIKQLGKRLKILDAAKAAIQNQTRRQSRVKPKSTATQEQKPIVLAKPELLSAAKPAEEVEPPPKLDRRSLKQKVKDPVTVAEINELRDWNVQLADWFSRSLGYARGPVTMGLISIALSAYALDVAQAVR